MTKYVLNSGGLRNNAELKKKFHNEIFNDLRGEVKILQCIFAQGREYWETKALGYQQSIIDDLPDTINPIFELAMPDKFEQQCKNADIIYFNGGDDHLIQYWMSRYNTKLLFKNKIVATNSASSDMLVSSFWTGDWRECMDGLGILPIKFIAHYKSTFDNTANLIDWDKAYRDLALYGDKSQEIYALEEGNFITIIT